MKTVALSNESLITSMLLGFHSAGKRQESEHSMFFCYRKTLLELEEKGVDSDFLYECCRRQWVSGFAKDFNKERIDKDVKEMLRMIEKKDQLNETKIL